MAFVDEVRRYFKGWDIKTVTWVLALVFIILQFIGIVFERYVTIKLGPLVLFALILMTVVVAAAVVKKQMQGIPVKREDLIVLLILAGMSTLAAIYLPRLLPQVFDAAAMSLKDSLQGFIPLP